MFKKLAKPRPQKKNSASKDASIQEWLPIADIKNNLLYRKDRHIVAVIRVQPFNINLLSDREKIRKVIRLEEALNGIDYPYQILSIARPVDLDAYILRLERMRSETDNIVRKKLLTVYSRQAAATVTSGEALERHFYILIPHPIGKNPQIDEEFVKHRALQLALNLSSADLTSTVCTDQELRNLQFIFSNPAHAAFERSPRDNFSMPPVLLAEGDAIL